MKLKRPAPKHGSETKKKSVMWGGGGEGKEGRKERGTFYQVGHEFK